jgi:LacI family gluconate utilization system Gnt-I transcriptional repressor
VSQKRTGNAASPTYDDVRRIPDPDGSLRPAQGQGDGKRYLGIVEIARMAGVSTITVSRALRNPDVVSEKTRTKILDIVQQTGYVSNPHARALRVGHSTIVVAFVSSMISPQFSIAMQKCSDILEAAGYQLLMGLTSYSYPKEIFGISTLKAIKPAAVLFTGVIELESNRRALRELGVPILESWAYPRDPIDMLVGFPNYDCGRLAARYLHGKDCKRVYFIGRQSGRGMLRQQGFTDTAAALGLEVKDTILLKDIQNIYEGKKIYQHLKASLKSGDGIFCANDILALGIHSEIKDTSAQRRAQPVLIGFGDIGYMSRTEPRLPLVGMDSALVGEKAAAMILNKLRGKKQPCISYVPAELYEPR